MQRYRVVIMLVLFGVLPVVAAFLVALSFLQKQESEPVKTESVVAPVAEAPSPAPEPPPTRVVLAAARALPVGTLLGKEELTTVSLDPDAVDADHIVVTDAKTDAETGAVTPGVTAASLRGHAVREEVAQGAPLTRSAVVGPRERGFLAAVLRPGARGVTIRVGQATSHAGLIDPGDRVDVILSAELSVDGNERSVYARTIVEDVRVVAIDRRPGGGATSASDGGDREAVERTEMVTATLEASPQQGDRLVLGEHEGRLSLAVRSLAAAPTPGGTAAGSAVDLREMLLPASEFSPSEARLRRAQELNDLSVRTRLAESRELLRAAVRKGASAKEPVRIFRGSEPAEEVVFVRQ